MLRRTTRAFIKQFLQTNAANWSVLDVGCSRGAWPEATIACDVRDLSHQYQDRFRRADVTNLPFRNHEFDFVICSHLLEHVADISAAIGEIVRVGRRGYIETPLPLFDNLVLGNERGHCWWVTFDDIVNELIFRPTQRIVPEKLKILDWNRIKQVFPESCCLYLYWEDSVGFRVEA